MLGVTLAKTYMTHAHARASARAQTHSVTHRHTGTVNATSGFVHAAVGKSAPVPRRPVSKGSSLGAARGLAETGEEIHFVPRSVPHAMHRPCVYMCVCGVWGGELMDACT